MSNKLSYAVFGLGRYGKAVAGELVKSGADVLAVDIDEEIVNDVADQIPCCKCADVTDPEVLIQLGISEIDVVVICIASNLEVSVLATMLCKEIGVKKVIAKCANEMNFKILSKVGADKVVFPEKESGIRLAKILLIPNLEKLMDLSEKVSVAEIDVKPEWVGKSLRELQLRKKYSINVAAIVQNNGIRIDIEPDMSLEPSMKLIVIADTMKMNKLY